jgi:predicted metalloprotease with PDZ domain
MINAKYAFAILLAVVLLRRTWMAFMRLHLVRRAFVTALGFALTVASMAFAGSRPTPVMSLLVDETQEARRIAFVHEEIRVHPGPLALAYPKWIPGEHGPTGPIAQLAEIRIHFENASVPWTRDPDDIYTIHVNVPDGTERISVDFDCLLKNTISDHQLLLEWNRVILYPLGIDKQELTIDPAILLPPNWQQGSSLHVTSEGNGRVNFTPISLERLIDSPVLAGQFFLAVQLKSSWPAELDFTCDSQDCLDNWDKAQALELFSRLVDQDRAMFGFRHWEKLHILISQNKASNAVTDGLEHEDSPYSGISEAGLSKKDQLEKFGWWALAHEQSHSWNGKYRRPAELYSKPDYQGPERTSLLWVYEGLNHYIGMLLATRAGFNDAAYMRDYIGWIAAFYSTMPARAYTALVDTATEDWVLRITDDAWNTLRRSQDYYDEGALIWLHADAIIRQQTQDRLSLDDFLRSFFGQSDTGPIVVTYTREEVEASLNAVCPYDWHAFFEKRVYKVNSEPPTEGLEAAGWRLIYNSVPNNPLPYPEFSVAYAASHSIGLDVNNDGTIDDVLFGSPAYKSGLGPLMKIIAVDGQAYSAEALNETIAHPNNGKISLFVQNFGTLESHEIHYPGSLRYPHLERIPGTHDYLNEIFEPRGNKERQNNGSNSR